MTAAGALVIVCVTGCGRIGFDLASPSDAGSDASVDAAFSCGFDLCDDFEAASLATFWNVSGSATLDPTVKHLGQQSLHLQSPAFPAATTNRTAIIETLTLATPPPTFYLRAWVLLDANPAPPNTGSIVWTEQAAAPFHGDYFVLGSATMTVASSFDNHNAGIGTAWPAGTWTCLLFSVIRSTANAGEIDVSGITGVMGTTDDATIPILEIGIGLSYFAPNVAGAQAAQNMWIDDVIVHSAPLTCTD